MQTTYQLNAQDIDLNFLEKIKKIYKNKDLNIVIEDIEVKKPILNTMEIYKSMEKTRESLKHIKIPKNLNINDLIDDMYDVKF